MLNRLSPVQRFRRLLKIDRKDITQVYVYALFNGLVNLSLPLGIQAIINLIQGGRITTSWMVLVAFVIGGIALTGAFQLLQLRIVENIAQKIFSRASFEFAYRIPMIKHDAFHDYYGPELTNRFFDTMTIQKGLPKILIDFSLALFQILVGLILLSLYHSFFILFSFFLIGLVYLIIAYTGPKGLKTSLNESTSKYKIAFWLEEIARTKISFKLMNGSSLNLDRTNRHVDEYLTARESHFKVLLNQFTYLVAFKVIIAAGLLITGSILVFNQEMNIGQFVAAEIIIILIIASVEKLIQSMDSIYDVLTALEKIGYVSDLPLDETNGLPIENADSGIALSLQNVTYSYPGSHKNTVDGLSLLIPGNQSVVIDGPGGSGKSTLLHLLAGVIEPSEGTIQVNGFPLKSLRSDLLREHIGYVLRENDIFQDTILENIRMGRKEISLNDVNKALQSVRLDAFVAAEPLGLNTELDPEGRKIPRNIQDRIILARAIVGNPKLLVLEDPMDHVPANEKEQIVRSMTSSDQTWKMVISSIDPVWKKYIKNSITLDAGKVAKTTLKVKSDA